MEEKEILEKLVKECNSFKEILKKQNKAVSGASVKVLKEKLNAYGIPYHFINKTTIGSKKELDEIEDDVRNAAYEIINRKGATYYGIGMCLVRITNAILGDENVILSVSAYDKEHDIYISTPAIVNNSGVKEKIFVPFNSEETEKIKNSITVIKEAINSL